VAYRPVAPCTHRVGQWAVLLRPPCVYKVKKDHTHSTKTKDSYKPFQDKKTWLCFLFSKSMESRAYANLHYTSLSYLK
jgi:hypothetical protein